MNTLPLVSIIIPVYNSEKYINRCIDSVLSQDYPNIEVVLIDDGSKDKSPEICDEYKRKYNNVIVLHIPNGGASLARKKGIELSKGELLTFVDSDDYVEKKYISAMYDSMRNYSTSVASCGVKVLKLDSINSVNVNSKYISCLLSDEGLMYRFFNYEFWGLYGSLYKKEVFSNIIFPKQTLSEDYLIKAQMFIKEPRISYISEELYVYEKHAGSLSNTKLSYRAFEEFDNVYNVYHLTKKYMPQYKSLALKNVIETSVKLLLMGSYRERKQFSNELNKIHSFLSKETINIVFNKYTLTKIRFLAITLRIFPWLSRFYNFALR